MAEEVEEKKMIEDEEVMMVVLMTRMVTMRGRMPLVRLPPPRVIETTRTTMTKKTE